jgi:mercuric ion transport protein
MKQKMKTERDTPNSYLIGGVVVSLVASLCCIGPFFLLATGLSAAWLSHLMIVEPLQPMLTVIALAMFTMAGRKTFQPATGPEANLNCRAISNQSLQITAFIVAGLIVIVLLTSRYWILLVD